jgi:hypothetical protein
MIYYNLKHIYIFFFKMYKKNGFLIGSRDDN